MNGCSQHPCRDPESVYVRAAKDACTRSELPDAGTLHERFGRPARATESGAGVRFISELTPAAPALAGAFPEIAEGSPTIHRASTTSRPDVASANGLEDDVVGAAVAVPSASRPSQPVEVRLRVHSSPATIGDQRLRRC